MKRADIPLPFYIEKYPIYVRFLPPPLGISDFDAQVSGKKFWKADENLRSVEKKPFYEIEGGGLHFVLFSS
jgi:hypothetical protein